MNEASAPARHREVAALGVCLAALVPVLHVAHATGLRNSLAAIVALWALLMLIRNRAWPPLALPLFAWLFLGFSSSLWSPDSEVTLKSTVYDMIMPTGAFYAAYLLSRDARRFRSLTAVVLAAMGLLGAFTLLALIAGQADALPATDRSGLTYLYPGPGVASTLAVYALPFALLFATGDDRASRLLGPLSLGCILVVALGSQNRMFWPAAVASTAAFYFWQWSSLEKKQRKRLVVAVLACTLAAAGLVVHLSSARIDGNNAETRLRAWAEWSIVASDAPLRGHGLGRKVLRETGTHRISEDVTKLDPNLEWHGHNLFLNVVLQLGAIGLTAYCLLLAALARQAYRCRDMERMRAGAALVSLLVAMLTKNLTDDFMDQAVVVAFWGYAGMLLGRLGGVRVRSY